MLERFVFGPWRQRAQVQASREHAVDCALDRFRDAIKANKMQADIYQETLADIRQRGAL